MAKRVKEPPPDRALLLRAVKWKRLPGHGNTIAETCKRFGISAGAYRRAARELGDEADIHSDDELILAGLSGGKPVTVESLIYYYDWINHAVLGAAELVVILERLIAKDLVRRNGERFELTREWP
jgi:hypothetical protein